MKKVSAAVGAMTTGMILIALASAGPANAAIQDCPSNRACGWINTNYGNPVGAWASNSSSLPGFSNNISSVYNKRPYSVGWYTDPGYNGRVWAVSPSSGGYFAWGDWRNDNFQSLYFYSY